MNFSVNSKVLLNRLVASSKAISNRPTITILGCFLFSLENDTLTITASNTENVVVSRIPVNFGSESGKVCVDAKRIIELLKAMPDCPVSFDINTSTNTILIRYTNGKYSFNGFAASEYPMDESMDANEKGSFNIPVTLVLSALDKVDFAIGTDTLRPIMTGVYWDITTDAITFVASDTHVLAKYRSTQTAPGVETNFILPGHVLALIRAFLGKQSEVRLTLTGKAVIFEGEDFKLRSTLIKGNYPNYNRVIPTNQPVNVSLDRYDFTNAVRRVAICADSNALIRLKISNNQIDVIAQDRDYNIGGEERIACDYAGDGIELGFNASYLLSVLNTLTTQKMVMKLVDASKPGVFLPSENDEYGEMTLLCMPLNIIPSE